MGLKAALCVFWLQFSLMVTFPEVPLGIFLFCMCVIAIGAVQVGRPRCPPLCACVSLRSPRPEAGAACGLPESCGDGRVVGRRRGRAGWAGPSPPDAAPERGGAPCRALQRALPQALIVVYAFRFPHLLNPQIEGSAHRAVYRRHVLHIVLRGPVLCLAAAGFSLFFYPAVSGRRRAECST